MTNRVLSDWDPRSEAVQRDPLAAYDAMRETQPVACSEFLGWSVFRHADVLCVLHDPATFSSQVSRHLSVPSGMDPPAHTHFRTLIEPFFSESRMDAFAPICRGIVRELLESARAGRALEWMDEVAVPLAVRVQCAFLRWPASMHAELRNWVEKNHAAIFAGDREQLANLADQFVEAIRSVHRGRSDGIADVTGELLRAQVDGRPLRELELVSILRNWTAGEVGTLSAAAGILMRYLAANPEVQQIVRDEPQRLPYAIEEILRIEGPLISNRRVTTTPVELYGRRIDAGETITVIWPAANRDPRAFDEPTRFRWDRDPSKNLLWGAGIHVCPGAPLARLQLRLVMEELLAATVRLEPGSASPKRATYPAGGYACVPVTVEWR